MTREDFSRVSYAAGAVRDARHGRVEVELPAVVGDRALVIERETEIAERLKRFQTRRTSHQFLFGERVGFHGHACKQQATDLRQRGERIGIVAVARRSHPERFFIQLNPFAAHAAEEHRADPAVAERERVVPLRRRRTVPKNGGGRCRGRRSVRSLQRSRRRHDDPNYRSKAREEGHDR